MRRPRRVSLLVLALTGCTVGPNYTKPETGVPAAYAGPVAPGSTVDPSTWWTAFGDPQLTDLVQRALKGNPDVQIAASRVRQARLQIIVARSQGLPQVNADANVSNVEFSKNAGLASIAKAFSGGGSAAGGSGTSSASGIALPGSGITTFAVGFDASWELDIFGGVRRNIQSARARTEAAEWNRRDAAVMLAGDIAQAYFALRLDQSQAQVVTDELTRQRRALQIAGDVASVGLTPTINVTRQRGQLNATQARLAPIQADIAVQIHAIGVLLGIQPEALSTELAPPPVVPLTVPAVPAGLPSDLLRRRPDIRAAERQLAAANADIGVAVADMYPKFSLTGMSQLISTTLATLFEGNSLQLTGTAMAQFPLLDFGRRRATVESRREDRTQALVNYRSTVLGALRDVEDALVQLQAERDRNIVLTRAVADQQQSATAIEAQYRTGFIAQDSLLNAQTDVLTAREQLAQSNAQLQQKTAALFKAIGGGWSETPVPERPAD
ncbi:efflux transporter outer membrane subunit [Sphingomonas bacterium]|uniref:efflux transporter outer membrane subunit n=1 Tax=Sphingomonas bacterium TaxID=1895847 RepID=UPI001575A5C7|nr:efflux transporter outer membrane subunit [Sphingomonas bacterium]